MLLYLSRVFRILCVWVLTVSAYFLWYSTCKCYTHARDKLAMHVQQEPMGKVPSSGTTALPLQTTTERLNSLLKHPELSKNAGTKPKDSSNNGNATSAKKSSVSQPFQGHSVSTAAATRKYTKTSKNPLMIPYTSTSHPPEVHRTLTDTSSPKLLCMRLVGRLGNELFEYASTLGLSLTLDRIPVFLNSSHLHKVIKSFRVSPSHLSLPQLKERCMKAEVILEDAICKFTKRMTYLDPYNDHVLAEYLQSYRYFENYETEIRKAVTFSDMIQAQADKAVQEFRQRHKFSTLVGMHIRHGDTASRQLQREGYPWVSIDYMQRSLGYFSQLYPNCVFVVASDSIGWCQRVFPKGYNVTFLSGNDPAVDMLILASLDHVIISFGTYSWWIGYLNRGRVVYMKNFIKARSFIANNFNPKGRDYIYPTWIPL